METIGGVASALEVDVFSEFSEIAFPILLPVGWCVDALPYHSSSLFPQQPTASGEGGSGSEQEGEGEERREAAGLRLLLREKTAEAVGKTWPSHSETQGGL